MSLNSRNSHSRFIALVIITCLVLLTTLVQPVSSHAAGIRTLPVSQVSGILDGKILTRPVPPELQLEASDQFSADDWHVDQIVGLPKGTLIHEGSGLDYDVTACVPEDNWLVLVIDGPRTADGLTWWDTSRKALDQLPTSGTGWVAPDAPLVDCGTLPPPDGDTEPPSITNVSWRQDGVGHTVVKATITDNVAVATATLWWNGQTIAMQLTGNDLYQAVVPREPNGVIRPFKITATDPSGNIALWSSTGLRIRYTNGSGLPINAGSALEPVNTSTGSFYSQHQDLYAPAPGLPFDFTRTYNTLSNELDGPFGFGWTHTYNLHLQGVDDMLLQGVVVTYADGRTANFMESGSGFISPAGDHNALSRDGSEYVLTTPSQIKYRFDENGRLISIQDSNGNTVALSYTGEHLSQIVDAAGRAYTFEYDGDRISKITDLLSRTYEYSYDGNGNLKTYKNPEGGLIQYTYNDEHWLLTMTDPNGHVFVNNIYDSRGRVTEQRDASGSLSTITYPDEQTAVITDNLNHLSRHIYDDQLRLIEDQDANGKSIFYAYDSDNNVVSVIDRGGHETKYSYDDQGNLLTRQNALDKTAFYQYDAKNNLIHQKDEAEAETTLEYDANNNLIHVHDAEGGDTYMTYDGRGLMLTLQDANTHTTYFSYDGQGNLKTLTDALSNVTTFEYDAMGRQTKMQDANGHPVKFEYDNNDRIKTIMDAANQSTVFTYDAVGNLRSVTDRRGYTTYYEYNENDSLMLIRNPRGHEAHFTYDLMYHRKTYKDWRGFTTTYEYDAVYNLSKVVDPKGAATQFGYDADRNLISITDALNQVTQMEYDALHRTSKVTDPIDGETRYTYDALGRTSTVIDAKNGQTQYGYDRLGRLVSVIDPLFNTTKFSYDAAGNLVFMKNARGFTTEYKYDAVNRLREQISPLGNTLKMGYDHVGNIISLTDARGNTTSFAYDVNDNLADMTDVLLGHTHYTYDQEGNRRTVTDPNNHTVITEYDPAGNRISIQLPMGEITGFAYDENNNLIAVTNAKGKTTGFAYDAVDLLISETNPLGFVTAHEYDVLSRLVKTTDANGNATRYGYDALNRLTSVTDALDGATRYEYDALGALTAEVDANNHRTDFDVDVLGRVIRETNPLDKVWQYEYDEMGNLVKRTDANGAVTRYTFDKDDRLTNIAYPSGPGTAFTYDPNGNLVGMVDASGTSNFVYDAINQLTSAARTSGVLTGTKLDYGYDPAGNRTQILYPGGKKVMYAYNANDWLTSTTDPAGVTSYSYDPVGSLTHQQNSNGTWTEMVYDDADRLIQLLNGKPAASNSTISSFAYTLDKVGNRTRTVESATRGQPVTWTKEYTYDQLYRLIKSVETPNARPYQTLTSSFSYDAVGNRLSMTTNITDRPNTPALPAAVTTNYAYNAANQLTSFVASGSGASTTTQFTYDHNGNRVSMVGPTRAINYTYDFENRLREATTFDVLGNNRKQLDASLSFTYDGLNRRVQRAIVEKGARKTAGYVYDGLGFDLLAQYNNPGSPRTAYYYRDPMRVLSRQEIQGNGAGLNTFYHYDGLGNVSAWTNQAGKEVQEYTYSPYGRLIDNNGPDNASNSTGPQNSLTFSGKLWDSELETYYFGARDYDPTTGVWLTQDPYRGQLDQPMTLHRTMYVNDNPINLVDWYGYSVSVEDLPFDLGFANEAAPSAQLSSSNSFGSNIKQSTIASGTESSPLDKSENGGTKETHPVNFGPYGQTYLSAAPNDPIYHYSINYKLLLQVLREWEGIRNDALLDEPATNGWDALASLLSKAVTELQKRQIVDSLDTLVVNNDDWDRLDFFLNDAHKEELIEYEVQQIRWNFNSQIRLLYQLRDDKSLNEEQFVEFVLLPKLERALIESNIYAPCLK